MSEAGFALYNRAFPIVVELLYALCLSMFLRPFLGDRRWQKAAVVFTLHLAASLIWDRLPMPQGAFTLIVTLLLLIAARLLELKKSLALLLGLLFWNAKISSALTVESLYFMAERLLPQPVSPPEVVYLRSAILLTILAVSHGIVLGAMLTILVRQLKKRGFTLRPRELCYLCLIPAAGILFGQVISNLLVEVKDGVLLGLYERHPALLAVVPVMALLFYGGSCLTISFQQGMDALQEEREILFVERQQAQAIQERIRQVERFYRQVRELKHEMRGHLTNLKGLASTGEYDRLIKTHDGEGTIFYLDPPYVLTEDYYGNLFGFPDHMLLAEILLGTTAPWLLSYNDCDTIRALYSVPGIYIEKIERINNMAQRYDPGNMYQELLISNYDTSLVVPDQISLTGFAPVERNYIWK